MSQPARSTRSPWQSCETTGRTPADGSRVARATNVVPRPATPQPRPRFSIADIDGEIGWARARLVTLDYARRSQGCTTSPRAKPVVRGRHLRAIRRGQAQAEARRLRRPPGALPRHHDPGHPLRRGPTMAPSPCPRRRVPGRQPAPTFPQSWLGPESSLVVVGDPNQAIYGWNGAKPELLDETGDHLPGCAVIHLRTNFRSTPEILAAAARVLDIEPQPAARPSATNPACGASMPKAKRSPSPARCGSSLGAMAVPGRTRSHQRSSQQCALHSSVRVSSFVPGGDGALLRRPEVMELIDTWHGDQPLSDVLADATTELPDSPTMPT